MIVLMSDKSVPQILPDTITLRTRPMPTVLWIELTSCCPFDCIFCSRSLLRGKGMHMTFELFRSIIAELHKPEIIRLNYSGESAHYPQLVQACELAASTGARVELVTALATLPESKLIELARSGLSQLTVSLHTLDATQYAEIYRFGTLTALTSRIETLLKLRREAGIKMEIDFAFVAMQRNLHQLQRIVVYALSLGIRKVSVHPVIRRDPIAEKFGEELEDGKLRPTFLAQLTQTINTVRQLYQGVMVDLSTPELSACPPLSTNPTPYPAPLPPGAFIFACDQDPWKTIHILADGKVVSCEVRDQLVLGNLNEHTLRQVWHSENYRTFRQDYLEARDTNCRNCAYKVAHFPTEAPRCITPGFEGESGLLSGWFAPEPAIVWSRESALLRMHAMEGDRLHLRLLLPAMRGQQLNLSIRCAAIRKEITHDGPQTVYDLLLPLTQTGELLCELSVNTCFRPCDVSTSADQRLLGIALLKAWTAP
jgi:MoaA/NifB/PqqE/SkfB family radical SAM enzyme